MPSSKTFCLGISHHNTPVALREALSSQPEALAQVLVDRPDLADAVAEWAVVSTCNRFELYAQLAPEVSQGEQLLLSWLALSRGLPAEQLRPHYASHRAEAVARHLLQVAAGLDSQVLGEPQILGQVAAAFAAAREEKTTGPYLTALFQAAIRAGKRARTETAISRRPASISSVAVSHIEASNGPLAAQNILVIGAGEMAELAVNSLRKRGASQIALVNRTRERALDLLGDGAGCVYRLDQIHEALVAADAVISATGAPHLILTEELIASVQTARAGRPLLLVDIALPRDIDPAVRELAGVNLINLDTLHDSLEEARQARAQEVPGVKQIVREELATWRQQVRQLQIRPVIRELRQKAEVIRENQVERTLKFLGDVDPATRDQIRHLSQALVNQLLHEPTNKLREEAVNGATPELASAVRELFNLEA
ncbi:MAG: glutamyl-tRNA reductase [Ardenticatenales bacterium]|nr:glutamyl-tRNA reductase [Ardenticatenales bacterium]